MVCVCVCARAPGPVSVAVSVSECDAAIVFVSVSVSVSLYVIGNAYVDDAQRIWACRYALYQRLMAVAREANMMHPPGAATVRKYTLPTPQTCARTNKRTHDTHVFAHTHTHTNTHTHTRV